MPGHGSQCVLILKDKLKLLCKREQKKVQSVLKLAGLAVPFSRQILNGFFSLFYVIVLIYLLKYETIEAYTHTFLSHIILAVDSVASNSEVLYFLYPLFKLACN